MVQLSNINTIKSLLSRHGFSLSHSLGQNFLINPSVCPRMAEACELNGDMGVLEIGPGIGVLTSELALRAQKVVAIELDRRLFPILDETLAEYDNVKIIHGDALSIDLHTVFAEEFQGKLVSVCANLPYYITSPLIMRLLEERLPIETITVMVQKEAAQRICALPGTREAGSISLAVHYYTQPELLFGVLRGSFIPAPNVDSAVIRLRIRKTPPVEVPDEGRFFRLISAAFAQRRKTALNAVSSGLNLSKDIVLQAIENVGLSPQIRAERMSLQDFAALDRALWN